MRRLTSSRASTSKDVLDDAERGPTPLPMQHLHSLPSPREDNSSPEPPDDDLSPDASPPPLPPPALQSGGSARRGRKSARIDGGGRRLHVHWARFKKRLGTGTAPSTSEVTGSVVTGGSSVFLPRPSGMFERKERGAGDDEKGGVDEVVVDRSWFDEIKSSVVSHSEADPTAREGAASRAGANGLAGTGTDQESVALHAEGFWALNTALVVLRYRFWPAVLDFFMLRFVDNESEDRYRKETWFLQKSLALWSAVFLITNWALTIGTLPSPVIKMDRIFFYGVTPTLTFLVLPMVMWDWPRDRPIIYQTWLSLSVWSWTIFLLFEMHYCGFYIRDLNPQPYKPLVTCGGKDFLGTLFFASALPTIGLFGLKLKRFPQLLGVIVYFVAAVVLILRWKTTWYRNILQTCAFHIFLLWVHYMRENAERRLYILRDQLKVQYKATQKAQINERKEAESKRRLTSYVFHEVRVPLNTALLAVQNMAAIGVFARSQDIEFKALEGSLSMMSKVLNDVLDFNRMDAGRFESVSKPYAFHQVLRSLFVPLRMATDARQLEFVTNLDENIDFITRIATYQALGEDSASIQRRLAENPEEPGMVVGDEMRLRQVITNLASNACKFTPSGGRVTITTRLLWPTRMPSFLSPHGSSNDPGETPKAGPETPTVTPGSPASGSPPPGYMPPMLSPTHGGVPPSNMPAARPPLMATRTVSSQPSAAGTTSSGGTEDDARLLHDVLSANHLARHDARHARPPVLEKVVVRIEVSDSGCGITGADMDKNKLFSAFNQTEQGRQQGGKGTGLGLALVRQIVKRTGGRLGVHSAGINQGSTFWVELPLGCGAKAVIGGAERMHRLAKMDSPNDFDALTDLTPPPTHVNSSKRVRPDIAPMGQATLHSIMDHTGKMASLPSTSFETTAPVLARMAVQDAGASPTADAVSLNLEHPDTAVPREPDTGTPGHATPHPTLLRDHQPPPIALPARTSAAFFSNIARRASTSTPGTPPSATSSFAITSVPPSAGSASGGAGATEKPAPPFPGMPVLVVDDDSLTRMLMKRLLTRLGCKVSTAENGEAALALLTGSPRPTPASENAPPTPDRADGAGGSAAATTTARWSEEGRYSVVFLDNQMPVLSGLEAVHKLRQAGHRDFVVGVTGNALLSDQEDYLEAGADYVLTKPVLEKSLRGMLALADERRKARVKPTSA